MILLVVAGSLLSLFSVLGAQKENGQATHRAACQDGGHSHRFSDLRMAPIEIRNVDDCGFSFMNLEEQTVGPDNYLRFSDSFTVIGADTGAQVTGSNQFIGVSKRPAEGATYKSRLKRQTRAIALYCALCKVALGVKRMA